MNAALRVEALRIELRGRAVLDRVDFALAPGELIALVGPNGAGKSTFLRAICGLIAPAAGSIFIADRPLNGWSRRERARRVAYLPQDGRVHWPIMVRDLVSLGRVPHSGFGAASSPEDAKAIARALRLCDLEELADRSCAEISGGELARVLLARALAVQAPLLLVDEPAAALDPAHQLTAMSCLQQEASSGSAVVIVTHDLSLAMRFAKRMAVFHKGRLVADGDPIEHARSGVLDDVFGVKFIAAPPDSAFIATRVAQPSDHSIVERTRSGGL